MKAFGSLRKLPTGIKRRRVKDARRALIEQLGYGDNWPSQRRKALERDNHTCQHCGRVGRKIGWRWTVHVHHRRKIAWFANTSSGMIDWDAANQLSNLITLCPRCHRAADRHDDASKRGFTYLK